MNVKDEDIIARHLQKGVYRLARVVHGVDMPIIGESPLNRAAAATRARKLADAAKSRAWIEDEKGGLHRVRGGPCR